LVVAYYYPFGEVVRPLVQQDRSPKRVFVLGVYASAVHARWRRGKDVICQALAVASEPRIFWDGDPDEAKTIIGRIAIPPALGTLEPAGRQLNGPSAKVLDEHILAPLGFTRGDAWLCDCLPEVRLFPSEYREIKDKYDPLKYEYDLNDALIPKRPMVFCDDRRAREIADEIIESQAELLILLGDIPIGQFLHKAAKVPYRSLQDYCEEFGYGERSKVTIKDREIEVLPVAHPRQIGVYGAYNEVWHTEHIKWKEKMKNKR
jgi:uracil-DNA glycosylase